MGTMHEIFDGSDPALIDAARAAFEADAAPYDFDLTRHQCAAPEPWSEYADEATGHRWGGWLAAMAAMSLEIAIMRAALERIAKYPRVSGDELGYEGCRKVAREALKTPNAELSGAATAASKEERSDD